MAKKIATHNSGTGEKSASFFRSLFVPFARCQRKTVMGQYKAGARYFDFRLRYRGADLVFAHGMWEGDSVWPVLFNLNEEAAKKNERVYIAFTYEGRLDNNVRRMSFVDEIDSLNNTFYHIIPVYIQIRKPSWETLRRYCHIDVGYAFKPINFVKGNYSWLFPVPVFYWLLSGCNSKANYEPDDCDYTMVDFL